MEGDFNLFLGSGMLPKSFASKDKMYAKLPIFMLTKHIFGLILI
jgi:hypothetical protein